MTRVSLRHGSTVAADPHAIIDAVPTDEATALRVDPESVAPAKVRIQLDLPTFTYFVLAVVGFLAVIAVFDSTSTMLTRIGIGLVIALALDPVVEAIEHRFSASR